MMEKIGKSPSVLVIESLNSRTGLGIRFGTWLLERGLAPNYDYMGTTRPGNCGQEEQILHQGLGVENIKEKLVLFSFIFSLKICNEIKSKIKNNK